MNPDGRLASLLGDWDRRLSELGLAAPDDPPFLAALRRVWDASDFVAQACLRDPALLLGLRASGELESPPTPGSLAAGLDGALDGVSDEPGLAAALRRVRHRQMVRIVWRDLAGLAPLAETMASLSALADLCVQRALGRLHAWAVAREGTPRDAGGVPQQLVVLGMGKLGAGELNLSSDIDLIYAFPAHGHTDGPRRLSNEEFFARLGQRLAGVLSRQTPEGFVFRVDLRLRPFGEAGPVAMSFDAMESYYAAQAREWERYAMIKARVIAGDPVAGARLMEILRPFVYRRYIDFGVVESLRRLKAMIERELHRKGMEANIKLGAGGIREIEFIGQAFQLVHGGRDPALQVRPILRVLELLGERGLLPDYVVAELEAAYAFLRLTENRLQAWRDEQTHRLPRDADGRARLARSMGFDHWTAFDAALGWHRRRVQGHFDLVFAAPQAEASAAEAPLAAVWFDSGDRAGQLALLREAGLRDPEAALKAIRAFRDSSTCRGLSRRGRERLDRLMPLLLGALAGSEDPDTTLDRLLRLLEAISRRTVYLDLLVENPLALSQLVRLTAGSAWIAEQITLHPLLLDTLLDPRSLYAPLRRADLERELDALLARIDPDDLEQQMDRLRQFGRSNRLRVAAADLTGAIPINVVSDYLTEIAEVVLERVLRLAWAALVARHGRPTGILGETTGFAIVGYGKLGGLELGYASDLDLVFLHGSRSATAMTEGPRSVANDLFYARLGQRIIHLLTTRTHAGRLFHVDMRLRPHGNAGLLVTGLAAFTRYQHEEAWTWEHQALVRARPVAGDPAVGTAFQAVRREVLGRPRDPEALRTEVREMREKMRANLDRSDARHFDLKQGVGGIADIEFMVQYLVLRWAHDHPDLLRWTDNLRLLEGIARHRLLEPGRVQTLSDAYLAFRAAHHRSALQRQEALVPVDALRAERQGVAEIWHRLMVA